MVNEKDTLPSLGSLCIQLADEARRAHLALFRVPSDDHGPPMIQCRPSKQGTVRA